MEYKILINPEASLDVDEHFRFYLEEKKSPEIALSFLKEVDSAFESFKIFPFYQIRAGENYRGYPLPNFPFMIFLEVFEETKTVKVVAVFHTKKHPNKYPK